VTVPFSHQLTAIAKSDFRELYGREPPIMQAVLALMSITLIILALSREALIYERVLFGGAAGLFLSIAFGQARPWWRWWWRRMEPNFGDNLSVVC
jgi:hypothetical protein